MTRRRAHLAAALFCWLIALVLLVRAPRGEVGDLNDRVTRDRLLVAAFHPDSAACAEAAGRRLQTLAVWLLLTSPMTLGYLARRPEPRAE